MRMKKKRRTALYKDVKAVMSHNQAITFVNDIPDNKVIEWFDRLSNNEKLYDSLVRSGVIAT